MGLLRIIVDRSPRMVRKLIRQLEFGEATQRGDPPAGNNIRFVAEHFCTGIKLGKVRLFSSFETSDLNASLFVGDVWNSFSWLSRDYRPESSHQSN
jgi:hypothetical protein